jgi:hypothetical protein
MCKELYNRSMNYFSRHVLLNSAAHAAAGFGLALLLQYYTAGTAFLNPLIGWGFILFSAAIHLISVLKK